MSEAGPAPTHATRLPFFAFGRSRQQVLNHRADLPRRASAGRSPPAWHPAACGGRQAHTDGRKCGRGFREIRSTPGSACRRRCNGPARSAGCIRERWCAPGTPTGNRLPCGNSQDFEHQSVSRGPMISERGCHHYSLDYLFFWSDYISVATTITKSFDAGCHNMDV